MDFFRPFLHILTIGLNLFSILILIWGIITCGKRFFVSRIKISDIYKQMGALTDAKNQLGTYVLFSLEVLIVADIIDTIVQPSWTDIMRLGAIVAIRTVISYFLNREMRESINSNCDK